MANNYEALKKIIAGLDERDIEKANGVKRDAIELDEQVMAKVITDRNNGGRIGGKKD